MRDGVTHREQGTYGKETWSTREQARRRLQETKNPNKTTTSRRRRERMKRMVRKIYEQISKVKDCRFGNMMNRKVAEQQLREAEYPSPNPSTGTEPNRTEPKKKQKRWRIELVL